MTSVSRRILLATDGSDRGCGDDTEGPHRERPRLGCSPRPLPRSGGETAKKDRRARTVAWVIAGPFWGLQEG